MDIWGLIFGNASQIEMRKIGRCLFDVLRKISQINQKPDFLLCPETQFLPAEERFFKSLAEVRTVSVVVSTAITAQNVGVRSQRSNLINKKSCL